MRESTRNCWTVGLLLAILLPLRALEPTPEAIRRSLDDRCFEQARRLSVQALAQTTDEQSRAELRNLLFESLFRLGELEALQQLAEEFPRRTVPEQLERLLRLIDANRPHLNGDHYFGSAEARAGLSRDEYFAKYRERQTRLLAEAEQLVTAHPELRPQWERFRQAQNRRAAAPESGPTLPERTLPVGGVLRDAAGKPLAGVKLELQTGSFPQFPDYRKITVNPHIGSPVTGPVPQSQETLRVFHTTTGPDGSFLFPEVPAVNFDYLAVLNGPDYPIRFLALNQFPAPDLELTLRPWRAAEPPPPWRPPETWQYGGRTLKAVGGEEIVNPFFYHFPRQLLTLPLPPGCAPERLRLFRMNDGQPLPFQLEGERVKCLVELPEESTLRLGFYEDSEPVAPPESPLRERVLPGVLEIETGAATFRLAGFDAPPGTPPLLALRGPDGVWRGRSRLELPPGTTPPAVAVRRLAAGPVERSYQVTLTFADRRCWVYTLTFHAGEAYCLVRERSFRPAEPSGWVLGFPEFIDQRCFLNWNAENGSRHWLTPRAEAAELARLQESVGWWFPNQVFGVGLTFDRKLSGDYVGLFSRRRGEWLDDDFAELTNGPLNGNYELDWPYPEMLGSTISMLTVNTTAAGEVQFRFDAFNGERQWGVFISDFARNDGPYRELSLIQHKNSSPRLEDFRSWHLDAPERQPRPLLLTTPEQLVRLRAAAQQEPERSRLAAYAAGTRKDSTGLTDLIRADAGRFWQLRNRLLNNARGRSRLVLLGREYGDVYSPVGGRTIAPMAAAFDLLLPSGAFTPEEERLVRQYLVLMAHMYLEPDFMNYRYNSRNANFEADRVNLIGTIGLLFPDNPDSGLFLRHCVERMRQSLEAYCTPGSGKWYENPACYYLHAAECRLNLIYQLWRQQRFDAGSIDRLKDFLRWGILLLMPKGPADYAAWTRPGDWFQQAEVRWVPPVGDHAGVGHPLGDFYWLLAPMYEQSDPEFAALLRWAWQVTRVHRPGAPRSHLLQSCETPPPEQPDFPAPRLTSRRLEGYGGIIRDHFGTPDELYILFKLGPGGYRYHRSEGSFIYFAGGRPLVYDGGEAGETWRHATLSFYDTHQPPAAGHLERAVFLGEVRMLQGVTPAVIKPGEPVWLSDDCHHQLVAEALRRFQEPEPVNHRTLLSVGDDYLVVHDDLRLKDPAVPVYWHLPVVAEAAQVTGPGRWFFQGRFGLDLELTLAGADFSESGVETMPHLEYGKTPPFTMKHLQLKLRNPGVVTAVLRPRGTGDPPLAAEPLWGDGRQVGVRLRFGEFEDLVFINRVPIHYRAGEIEFRGRYGVIRKRGAALELTLPDAGEIRCGRHRLESSGEPQQRRFENAGD